MKQQLWGRVEELMEKEECHIDWATGEVVWNMTDTELGEFVNTYPDERLEANYCTYSTGMSIKGTAKTEREIKDAGDRLKSLIESDIRNYGRRLQ